MKSNWFHFVKHKHIDRIGFFFVLLFLVFSVLHPCDLATCCIEIEFGVYLSCNSSFKPVWIELFQQTSPKCAHSESMKETAKWIWKAAHDIFLCLLQFDNSISRIVYVKFVWDDFVFLVSSYVHFILVSIHFVFASMFHLLLSLCFFLSCFRSFLSLHTVHSMN